MQSENTPERALDKVSDSLFVTSGEDYGVALTPPPEPHTCEHCGKTLYYRGIRNGRGEVERWLFVEPCDCPAAKAAVIKRREIAEEERRVKELEEINRRRTARIERIIGQSGVGARFRLRTFDAFKCTTEKQRKCLECAQGYARDFGKHLETGTGLFIAGSIGTGKTHLAAAISLELMNKGTPVIFRTAIDMFTDVKRSYNGYASEAEILNEYKTVQLLVIDDLGKEHMTEWAAAILYGVINARYENMLPTIITTNFSSDDLLRTLGDEPTRAKAILSRLMETSIYISMKWGDYRTGGNAENG